MIDLKLQIPWKFHFNLGAFQLKLLLFSRNSKCRNFWCLEETFHSLIYKSIKIMFVMLMLWFMVFDASSTITILLCWSYKSNQLTNMSMCQQHGLIRCLQCQVRLYKMHCKLNCKLHYVSCRKYPLFSILKTDVYAQVCTKRRYGTLYIRSIWTLD